MSRRASLPGAEELFRRTSAEKAVAAEPKEPAPAPNHKSLSRQGYKSPLRWRRKRPPPKKAPKHEEKITFYCTGDDLMALEKTRLELRSEHGVAADRGRSSEPRSSYVLEDFAARSHDSILLRKLQEE